MEVAPRYKLFTRFSLFTLLTMLSILSSLTLHTPLSLFTPISLLSLLEHYVHNDQQASEQRTGVESTGYRSDCYDY